MGQVLSLGRSHRRRLDARGTRYRSRTQGRTDAKEIGVKREWSRREVIIYILFYDGVSYEIGWDACMGTYTNRHVGYTIYVTDEGGNYRQEESVLHMQLVF